MFGCVSRPSVDFTAHLNFTAAPESDVGRAEYHEPAHRSVHGYPFPPYRGQHLERPHHPVGHDLRVLKWGGGRGCEPRRRFTYHPVMIGSAWFIRPQPKLAPAARLICLPYAALPPAYGRQINRAAGASLGCGRMNQALPIITG